MSTEMYEMLKKIFKARVEHYISSNPERAVAYQSALDMLEYAHQDNYESLCQFDYL